MTTHKNQNCRRNTSCTYNKRLSQWEELMKKFSNAHKKECKTASLDMPRMPRSVKYFPTGSQYEGTWDVLGMSGYGVYVFPNCVIYEGEFEDGLFHGQGELRYEGGLTLRGKWHKGLIIEKVLLFDDGLEYDETDWKYCKMPDRRFSIEYNDHLQPAGLSFMTADRVAREIPPGMYDTCDGFYDPKTKVIYKAKDLSSIVRSPSENEQKWIIDNCRTNPCESQGPRAFLYEEWSAPQETLPVPPPPSARYRHGSEIKSSLQFEQDFDAYSQKGLPYVPPHGLHNQSEKYRENILETSMEQHTHFAAKE